MGVLAAHNDTHAPTGVTAGDNPDLETTCVEFWSLFDMSSK
jgi:hypothetical protein